ncbi:carbonic anhydrase, partial [Nostoc sp. NIES-2111]
GRCLADEREEGMGRVIDGYRRFRADVWPSEHARYQALAALGQAPETMVIACSDSRVDPQTVFNAGPGEFFVVRNVAGLVPAYTPDAGYHGTSAALEYAVRVLRVKRIAVLGHGKCGGIRALVEGAPEEARDFVKPWMKIAEPVLRAIPDHVPVEDIPDWCEYQVVKLSLQNLMTFPWIQEAVAERRLKLQGFRFEIFTGILTMLQDDQFVPVL